MDVKLKSFTGICGQNHFSQKACQWLLHCSILSAYIMQRMFSMLLTFKHPPVTWNSTAVSSGLVIYLWFGLKSWSDGFTEIIIYVNPQKIKGVLKTRDNKGQATNLLFLYRKEIMARGCCRAHVYITPCLQFFVTMQRDVPFITEHQDRPYQEVKHRGIWDKMEEGKRKILLWVGTL